MAAIRLLFGKSWLLFVVVVAASGLGGGAYAAWTASLHIEGTIQTGNVAVVWDMQEENEFVGVLNPDTGEVVNGPVPPEKDVTQCISDLESGETSSTVNFQILNAYPSYTCQITMGALVTGSVPVHVSSVQRHLVDGSGTDVLDTEMNMGVVLTRKVDAGDGSFRCDMSQPVGAGTQLHRGDRFCAIIDLHPTMAAQQLHTYSGSLWIDLIQWNFAGQQVTAPEPLQLADLVAQITAGPTASCDTVDGELVCTATVSFDISNTGAADVVTDFDVRVTSDQHAPLTVTIAAPLTVGATRSFAVTTLGPANCFDPDCTVLVIADSGNVVDEEDESNNSDTVTGIG